MSAPVFRYCAKHNEQYKVGEQCQHCIKDPDFIPVVDDGAKVVPVFAYCGTHNEQHPIDEPCPFCFIADDTSDDGYMPGAFLTDAIGSGDSD